MQVNPKFAGHEGDMLLLRSFHAHVEDMRSLLLCKICTKPLYEPYTLACGHTYCYSCLDQWFNKTSDTRRRENCPDCRADVVAQPSPNYLLRDMVHMFVSRAELLPENETTSEHDEAKLIEAQLLEADRKSALFKGVFCYSRRHTLGPVRDEDDGVLRCPMCTWEIEGGECGNCGYSSPHFGLSESDNYESDNVDLEGSSSLDETDQGDSHLLDTIPRARSGRAQGDLRDVVRGVPEVNYPGRPARGSGRPNQGLRGFPTVFPTDGDEWDSTITEIPDDYLFDHHEYDLREDERTRSVYTTSDSGSSRSGDAEGVIEEDENMALSIDDDDEDSTTSFHRSAILARDRGINPPFDSDFSASGSERGGGETASTTSNESGESGNGNDLTMPSSGVRQLATRPARIILDSDDESSSGSSGESSSHKEEEEDDDSDTKKHGDQEDHHSPSPPRPAAARQARLQMQRGRRSARGRGRPRVR